MKNLILGVGLIFMVSACSHSMRKDHRADYQKFLKAQEIAPADPNCVSSKCQGMRMEMRWVAYVGEQVYCYWDEKKAQTGTDYKALAKTLEQSITDATSKTQYFVLLTHWAAALQDGHVNAIALQKQDLEIYSSPVRFELLNPATNDEQLVITQVKSGTPLQPGDTVTEIDDQPVASLLTQLESQTSGSTPRMRRFWATRYLVDVLGVENSTLPVKITVQRKGVPVVAELERAITVLPTPVTESSAPAAESTGADLIKASILPGNVGYLRIDGFSGSQMPDLLDKALDRMMKTKGLIIDVRHNGGGDLSGNTVLARLSSKSLVRFRQSARMSDMTLIQRPDLFALPWKAGDLFSGWVDREVEAAPIDRQYLNRPVVGLISPYCFSACDTFSSALKVNKLATLIGSGTGGGTGNPLVFELPVSSFAFRYSTNRGHTAQDHVIEGVGTLPDIEVHTSADDVRAGHDPVLAKAIEMASGASAVVQPAAASTVNGLHEMNGPIWTQSLDQSPTVVHMLELQRYGSHDEGGI